MCHLKLKNHIEKYRTKLTTKIDIKNLILQRKIKQKICVEEFNLFAFFKLTFNF